MNKYNHKREDKWICVGAKRETNTFTVGHTHTHSHRWGRARNVTSIATFELDRLHLPKAQGAPRDRLKQKTKQKCTPSFGSDCLSRGLFPPHLQRHRLEASGAPHQFGSMFADSDAEDDRPTLSSSGTATGDSAGSRVAGRRDRSRSRHGRIEPGGSAHSRVAQAGDTLGVADRAEVLPDKWIGLFTRLIRSRREAFGKQLRPLILRTMYTGTNSQSMVLRMTGLKVQDETGAEIKASARRFLRINGLEPANLYEDASDMTREVSSPDLVADLFAAGFPCQPWSGMTRKRIQPSQHTLYKEFENTIEFILKARPPAILLENVPGFVSVLESASSGEGQSTGWGTLQRRLDHLYHLDHAHFDVVHYMGVRRARVWMWGVRKDVGPPTIVAEARRIALSMVSAFDEFPRQRVEDHMFPEGSPEWVAKVMTDFQGRRGSAFTPCQPDSSSTRWGKEAIECRAALGREWAEERPMAESRLHGLSGTPRQREVLNTVLLWRCRFLDLDPRRPSDLVLAKRGLSWDVSQSLDTRRASMLRETQLSTLCTGAQVYSFEHDRRIHPEELLACFGWPAMDCRALSMVELTDLIGDSQALPPLAISTWALLFALGNSLPGFWEHGRG